MKSQSVFDEDYEFYDIINRRLVAAVDKKRGKYWTKCARAIQSAGSARE